MAVGVTSDAMAYTATTGTPSGDFTVCCWAYLGTGAATRTVWALGTNGDNFITLFINTSSQLVLESHAGVGSSYINFGNHTIAASTWYGVAATVSGANANMSVRTEAGVVTRYSTATFTTPTRNQLAIGKQVYAGAPMNGRVASFKVYNTALSQTDREAELTQYFPVRTLNLTAAYRLKVPETTDYSGNGNTLTGGTGTTTVTGPSIPDEVTDPAPTAPTGFTSTAIGSTSVDLTWTAATDPGGGIAYYEIVVA